MRLKREMPCSDAIYRFSYFAVIPARYSFGLLGCFGFFNVYAMRVNLSVTMVAMVGKRADVHTEGEHVACKELLPPFDNGTTNASAVSKRVWCVGTTVYPLQ